jgi:type IV secretory pathway VirB4 component
LGTAIGKPSSFSPEPMVKFYALTGLSNDQDSYIMAVAAKAACLRVALSHLKSLFIGDELSVLLRKDGFSAMVGELCATARKDGLSIVLSSQDPDTICQSVAAAMIMQLGQLQNYWVYHFKCCCFL